MSCTIKAKGEITLIDSNWKDDEIYILNSDRRWILSNEFCILLEELAAYLFINQVEICNDYNLASQIIHSIESEDVKEKYDCFKKYLNIEKDAEYSASFSCSHYQMYYLSSWITRCLCDITNKSADYSFDTFFESYFTKASLSYKNFWYLQKFSKSTNDYSTDHLHFKAAIFEYINNCVAKNYFYRANGTTFDLSKQMLFMNIWGIIKSYYFCQNPISSENKHIFAKLVVDFFSSFSRTSEVLTANMNLAFMDFSETDLSGVKFYSVDFTQTNFYNANLDAISLNKSILINANFNSAFMEVSGIVDCDCSGASFSNAHLLSSVIIRSNLYCVDFRQTNFMECDVVDTNLASAKFNKGTAINSSVFDNSDLSQTDITEISISTEQMKYFWENTTGVKSVKVYRDGFEALSEDEYQTELYEMLSQSIDEYLLQNKFPKDSIDVFISHATLEKSELAMPIYEYLVNVGYSCWIDNYEIEPNKLRKSIEAVIQNCQSAIVILSDIYKARAWTRYELLRLVQESKRRKINVIIIAYSLTDIKNCPDEFKRLVASSDKVSDDFLERLKLLLKHNESTINQGRFKTETPIGPYKKEES